MDEQSPTQAWSNTREGLAQAIGAIQGALPGSVVVRTITCGKPDCPCNSDADARHGPYIQWTRSVRGRTVNRILTQEQLDRYRPWFDNARQLKDLIAKLEVASVQAFESTEAPRTRTPSPTKPQRRQRPAPPTR